MTPMKKCNKANMISTEALCLTPKVSQKENENKTYQITKKWIEIERMYTSKFTQQQNYIHGTFKLFLHHQQGPLLGISQLLKYDKVAAANPIFLGYWG